MPKNKVSCVKNFIISLILAVSVFSFSAFETKADVFVWEDPKSGLTVSVPDTWDIVHSSHPDTVVTFQSSNKKEDAKCEISLVKDLRFTIYPHRYEDEIQILNFGKKYWIEYLYDRYDTIRGLAVKNSIGIGRGYAGMAEAQYVTAGAEPSIRHAIGFVSHYYDDVYTLECSTLSGAFNRWRSIFMSVAGSVDFKKKYHENLGGNYRNFLKSEIKEEYHHVPVR